MHFDDALHADVLTFIIHTICASVAGLFDVLGLPTDELAPSVLSGDKFEGWCDNVWKPVGRWFNSCTLTVGVLPHKHAQLLELLVEWSSKESHELKDIAHLFGRP